MKLRMFNFKNTLDSKLYKNELGQPLEAYIPVFSHTASTSINTPSLLTNPRLQTGRTYYVKTIFRTRGDGNSTENSCATMRFYCSLDKDSKYTREFSHSPSEAYNEIGGIVSWTYSFIVDSDVKPYVTNLIGDSPDGQTIDVYYYKYWDSEGNVYNEEGVYIPLLEVEDKVNHKHYFTPVLQENLLPDDFIANVARKMPHLQCGI